MQNKSENLEKRKRGIQEEFREEEEELQREKKNIRERISEQLYIINQVVKIMNIEELIYREALRQNQETIIFQKQT